MSKTKFTKGEWLLQSKGSDLIVGVQSKEDDQSFNMINSIAWIDLFDVIDEAEQKSNAHLIAAAPKLYAMVETLINRGVELLSVDEIDDEEDAATIHADFNDSVLLAEKLLAEARGE